MHITMTDVRTRLSNLNAPYHKPATVNGKQLYEQAKANPNNMVVRRVLSDWESLSESEISSLSMLLDIYDTVAERGDIGLLKTMTSAICETAIPKVRNGMETNNLVKHRTARFKTKIQTKVQNKIDDIENLVDGKKISDAQDAVSAAVQQKTVAQANDEKENSEEEVQECYDRLVEASNKVISCDRIIENYSALSHRFNIDQVIQDNYSLGVYDTVFEICKLIDTYEMPFKVKYNTALESCMYGFEKNCIKYENKEIAAACSDYFLLAEQKSDDVAQEIVNALKDGNVSKANLIINQRKNKLTIAQLAGCITATLGLVVWSAGPGLITLIAGIIVTLLGLFINGCTRNDVRFMKKVSAKMDKTIEQLNDKANKKGISQSEKSELKQTATKLKKYKKEVDDKIEFTETDPSTVKDASLSNFKEDAIITEKEEISMSKLTQLARNEYNKLVAEMKKVLNRYDTDYRTNFGFDKVNTAKRIHIFPFNMKRTGNNINVPLFTPLTSMMENDANITYRIRDHLYSILRKKVDPMFKISWGLGQEISFKLRGARNYTITEGTSDIKYIFESPFDIFKKNKKSSKAMEIPEEKKYDYVDKIEYQKLVNNAKKDYDAAIRILRPLIAKKKYFSIAPFGYNAIPAGSYGGKCNYIELIDWDMTKYYDDARAQMYEDGCEEFWKEYKKLESALKSFISKKGYTTDDMGDWDGGTLALVKSGTAYALQEHFLIKDMRSVLEDAQIFDPEKDYEDVEYITEEEPEDDDYELPDFEEYVKNLDEEYGVFNEKQSHKLAKTAAKSGKNEVKDLINTIKSLPDKSPEPIKKIIRKIYSKSPDQVINGIPNLLNWIRVGLVCSTITTMGPVTMIITFIVDQFIAMNVKRKDAERMVKKFISDIDATKLKIEKTKDPDEKKRLEEYLKTLTKQTDKLVEYRDSLHTDDENMEREPDNYGDDNDDNDFDDFDFDFEESYSFKNFAEDIEVVAESISHMQSDIIANLESFDYETTDMLSECIATIPEIVDRSIVVEALDDIIDNERSKVGIEKYRKIDTYTGAKYTLEHTSPISYDSNDLYTSIKVLQATREVCDAFNILLNSKQFVVNEMDIGNSLKLAREKLKKGISKLSDTEKAASKQIDMSAEKIEKNIERSMTSDNREAVIKGSILPSASKCLKTALASGALALINPVLAVIGVLGKMACSRKYKAKERQLILDEIEVELQMVDRYLKVAEDKNDMEATKHLLTTKRTLERERQRIKYKMNVKFKQHVPGTKETEYDNY